MRLFNHLLTILLAAAALGLTACDDIASGDRYDELAPIDPKRSVLLEEYTGQLCIRCPAAHAVIEELAEQYGDRFIAVSFHCGGAAFSIPANDPNWGGIVGLATPLSEEYGKAAGITNMLPKGRVDRHGQLTDPPVWSDAVRQAVVLDSPLQLELKASLSDDHKSLSVKATMLASSNVSGARLQLWVVENDITAMQLLADGSADMNYVHNNVFRADVNGYGGEAVTLQQGVYTTAEHTLALSPDWVPEHLAIVGFVYNDSGVLQATRFKF